MPSPTSELRIGAAYIRVSTDDQLEYSPEAQLEKTPRQAASSSPKNTSSWRKKAAAAAPPKSAPSSTA